MGIAVILYAVKNPLGWNKNLIIAVTLSQNEVSSEPSTMPCRLGIYFVAASRSSLHSE